MNKYLERLKKDSQFRTLIFVALAALLIVIFFFLSGFAFWYWVALILWVIFFVGYFRFFAKFSIDTWILFFIVSVVLTIALMAFSGGKNVSRSTSTSSRKLTEAECQPLYDKYNNKVLKMTGDNFIGQIGIKVTLKDCQVSARYVITFNTNLPQNPHPDIEASATQYNYILNLHNEKETGRGPYGYGVISAVRQNAMKLPDPFIDSPEVATFYRNPTDNNIGPTGSFYWTSQRMGNFSQERYQEYLDDTVFEIVDGLPFVVKEPMSIGGFSYAIDHRKAEVGGRIVKTFHVTIKE